MTHRTRTHGSQPSSGAEGGQARSGSRVFAGLGQLMTATAMMIHAPITRHGWRVTSWPSPANTRLPDRACPPSAPLLG